jgi:hypothetical protein
MRRNICPNPALANYANGYSAGHGTGGRITVSGFDRSHAYRVTSDGSNDNRRLFLPQISVQAGQTVTASVDLRRNDTGTTGIKFDYYDSSGAYSSSSTIENVYYSSEGAVVRRVYSATVPSGITALQPVLESYDSVSGDTTDATDVRYETGAYTAHPYRDGDSTGWQWDGPAGSSTSRETPDTSVNVLAAGKWQPIEEKTVSGGAWV